MRIGKVVKTIPDKKIGFIRSEDLHEDVFFHFSILENVSAVEEGELVEYEIDELAKIEKLRLQATCVRISPRPLEMKIQPSDAPNLRAKHHPKARRRRPTWRPKTESDDQPNSDE